MDKVKNYVYLVALVLSLLYSLYTIIYGLVKKRKEKGKMLELGEVVECIMAQMIKAEEIYNNFQNFGQKFSENKLEDVLTKVQNYCLTAGVKYDENAVRNIVEKFIDFSKKINSSK